MVAGDPITILSNLDEIKINNIKNIFLNNILVENTNGIVDHNNVDDIENYTKVISLTNNFLKNTLTDEIDYNIMNYTLDGNNFIKYLNIDDEYLRNENNFYLTNLASNNLKKYIFLCDVMADYYETNERYIGYSEYDYIHKLKFNCGQSSNDYCSDILILDNPNIIKYKYSNNKLNIVQPNSDNQNSKTFEHLFEDIIINRDYKFDKKVYGKYHYKYKKNEFKFYTALINYNILLAYYYYINKRPSPSDDLLPPDKLNQKEKNKITNQISNKIILFKNLFQNYDTELLKTKEIKEQSNVRNDLSESEKISNFNEINQELIEINKKIEYKRDKDMMFKDNININIKDKIKTITIFVYYTIITFFLLNVILFNYYSEETNKFLSIIITIFLIFIYFVLKLFKNDYYEFFDGTEAPGTTTGTTTEPTETPESGITNYVSDKDMYELLTADLVTLDLWNINLDNITDPAQTSDITLTSIRTFFSIFSCQPDSDTNCPETSIQSMFQSIDSNSTDGKLLESIQTSGAKLEDLIDEVEGIRGNIDSVNSLITTYGDTGGIIDQLNTTLANARDNNKKLQDLNYDLLELNNDLSSKNILIEQEIENLKGYILQIEKLIQRNTSDLTDRIKTRDAKIKTKQELQFTVDRLKRQTQNLFEINNALNISLTAIQASNQRLNGDIVNSLEELLAFRNQYNERSKQIADWYAAKEEGELSEQEASREIINGYNAEKENLEKEADAINQIKANNNNLYNKIQEKITNLSKIQNKKTYVYNGKIINIIDYDVNTEDDVEPFLKFRNQMEKDISNLLDIYQTRIIIDNEAYDTENNITFDLKILPSPSYLKLEEHIKKMHELQLILQSLLIDDTASVPTQKERKNNLLKTTYAKYIVSLNLDLAKSGITSDDDRPQYIKSKDVPNDFQVLDDLLLDYTGDQVDSLKTIIKNNNTGIISNNIKEIEEILKNINNSLLIKQEEPPNYKTYYDEVHPNLQNELTKYQKIDNNNKLYDHIIESKLNTTEHDLLYLNALNKFFIHLSIYLGLFYIYASHFNYFGYTINFFITIIVLLILLYYLFKDIHKKVRRDSSKSYWKYSKNYFEE